MTSSAPTGALDPLAPPLQSSEHAVIAGLAAGAALRAGLVVTPVLDERGDYTAAFDVSGLDVPPNVTIRCVVPPPAPKPPPRRTSRVAT